MLFGSYDFKQIHFLPEYFPRSSWAYSSCPTQCAMLVTEDEIFNPNVPGLPSKDLVKRLCEEKGSNSNTLRYTSNFSARSRDFFIKYNNATMGEAHAQFYFRSQLKQNPRSTVLIPEVYHAWRDYGNTAYIVMEYITVDHFASDQQRAQH